MVETINIERVKSQSHRNDVWILRIIHNAKAMVGVSILFLFIIFAVLAPILTPGDPGNFVARGSLPPSSQYLLGTGPYGENELAQILWGGRTSLEIGFATGLVATFLSVLIGLSAGYFRGLANDLLSLLINIFLVMPGLPLAIILAAYLPSGPVTMVGVLSITGWAWGARVFRSQVLSLREKDFVAAALVSGESHFHIIFSEIFPNMVSLVVSNIIGATVYGIGAEVALEFLGLGNSTSVSWGTILFWAENTTALMRNAWWQFLPAGLCVGLVGFALTMINSSIDQVTNPRLRSESESAHVLRKYKVRPGRSTPVISSYE